LINKKKVRILLTFGGRSREHNVSIISASNIIRHFDPEKYKLELLYIKKNGEWLLCDQTKFKLNCDFSEQIIPTISGVPVYLPAGLGNMDHIRIKKTGQPVKIDLVFTLLHGKNGAGGIMQGVWDTVGIPSVSPSLIGGAIGFDKDIMKRLLSEAGVPICKYMVIYQHQFSRTSLDKIKEQFSFPFFIKPANSGSSLGVHKIYKDSDFETAAKDVFLFDDKLIVEEYIDGCELELYCFASKNGIKTSVIRQTIIGSEHDFYTYDAKYGPDNDVTNIKNIPADIPRDDYEKVLDMAIRTYTALEGRGEVRMDLFYSSNGTIYLNEINTVPSFMSEKSQPSLWHGCGMSHGEIIDDLISSALG